MSEQSLQDGEEPSKGTGCCRVDGGVSEQHRAGEGFPQELISAGS